MSSPKGSIYMKIVVFVLKNLLKVSHLIMQIAAALKVTRKMHLDSLSPPDTTSDSQDDMDHMDDYSANSNLALSHDHDSLKSPVPRGRKSGNYKEELDKYLALQITIKKFQSS